MQLSETFQKIGVSQSTYIKRKKSWVVWCWFKLHHFGSTEHYMILNLTACEWVYRKKNNTKEPNKKKMVPWHPEKKIFWVYSFLNQCWEEEWVTGETMTGGTDFVGKYSANIIGKDVAVSDRHGKQRSCQNMVYPSANKTDAIFKLFVSLHFLPICRLHTL